MIGTRLDEIDAPRLIKSKFGWWFIGNRTWTLLKHEAVDTDGELSEATVAFLRREGAFEPRVPRSFSLTVLTTTSCNLGCGYCFQNVALDPNGGRSPIRIDRGRLSLAAINDIVKFTSERMQVAGLDKLYMLLFGGEPLLNSRACLTLLDKANDIGLTAATMTTNGVLLTSRLAKSLELAGIVGAQVTFDGSREDHDRIRFKQSGEPTFDRIVRNVAEASNATNLRWNLRVNVSHHNFARIGQLFNELDGRIEPQRCTVTFAWVGDAGFGYSNELQRIEEVSDGFVAWNIAAIEAGYQVIRPTMRTTCQICSEPGGRNGAVINADGRLYSCWQSAGKRAYEVGNISDGYNTSSDVIDRWVTCGYEYEQTDPAIADKFQDQVDGRILDYIYTTGRL
jgi:uncharacterized protein